MPWSKVAILGMVIQPLIGNPYFRGPLNPYGIGLMSLSPIIWKYRELIDPSTLAKWDDPPSIEPQSLDLAAAHSTTIPVTESPPGWHYIFRWPGIFIALPENLHVPPNKGTISITNYIHQLQPLMFRGELSVSGECNFYFPHLLKRHPRLGLDMKLQGSNKYNPRKRSHDWLENPPFFQ